MKYRFCATLICLSAFPLVANSQNCGRTSTGYPPLTDLGIVSYKGFKGGLYPYGSNTNPWRSEAKSIAQKIVPLDTNGNPDPVNGKIVMVSIGMSNTTQESQAFIAMLDTFKLKNPRFLFIDGAQGGVDVVKMEPANSTYWPFMLGQLKAKGSSSKQVQLIWLKQAYANPTDTVFPHHADTMMRYLTSILQTLHKTLPNASMAYLSSRIYGGYAPGTLHMHIRPAGRSNG